MKKVQCALSSTPRMWETKGRSHRSWMRSGTPSARLLTYQVIEGSCHRASGPFRFCEASWRPELVRMQLTTFTQGYTPQRLARSFVLGPPLHDTDTPMRFLSISRWNNHRRQVKVSKWKSASWSISCLDQKMLISASGLSQRLQQVRAARHTSRHQEQVEELKWQMQRALPKQQRKEGRRREEASAARRRATQETPREETAMELLWVLDAVYAWTSKGQSHHRTDDHVFGLRGRTSSLSWRRWRSRY